MINHLGDNCADSRHGCKYIPNHTFHGTDFVRLLLDVLEKLKSIATKNFLVFHRTGIRLDKGKKKN